MSTQSSQTSPTTIVNRGLDVSVTVSALLFWAIVLYRSYTEGFLPSTVQYGVVFVGGIMTVYALNETKEAVEERDWIDGIVLLPSSIILISAAVFFATNFELVYLQQQGYATEHQYMLARLIILSILYLTWREFGNLFLGLVGGMILYGLYGNYIADSLIISHGGMDQLTLLQTLVTDLGGFYGSLTQLTASWIAPFLLYAGLLFAYGAFDLILRVAIQSAQYIESGVAQTAVLASAIIGSINGSYTANAAMTGSFSIPTMKESGMAGHRAAAIEAVASTSGQVLPPVMGASAFIMASTLQTGYINIVVAGLVPAAILVACISIAVHYTAISDQSTQNMDFENFFDDALTTTDKVIETVRFGVPFLVLIGLLGVLQYTVTTSAMWTIFSMVGFGVFLPVVRSAITGDSPGKEFANQFWNTVHGFRRGAVILAPIAIILVAVSGVVGILQVTGVPSKMAIMIMGISGGVLLFAVLLAMAVSILMGVGMPTAAAYVIVSVLIAPALTNNFDIPQIASHYTVFYAAILAGITPPVATAAVVAAGIAEANFWRTCGSAIKISAPLFVLPVAFAFNPSLVSFSLGLTTVWVGLLVLLGAIAIIYGLNYPFTLGFWQTILARVGLSVLGVVVMVYPNDIVKLAGIAVFAAVFFGEKMLYGDMEKPTMGDAQ
ncbi:TRAP transporter fused permease subunit [Salarchaeum sp. JOR-1]|uniref:TRAP transporter permease n=1 Tax=Salarchaeum sp. JOR-1 TaxID=2599399 RepID=UPI0011989003|nr:TRAP transporter fused permease subunit [Salarchaeum sp. JOR-1]QDX39895.1 TRAP transporter fused permease subunit [Salarchaeum sp. JOR-1]